MLRWVGIAVVLVGLGCTDASLSRVPGLGQGPVDNKLAIRGQFCTEDPTTLSFPVKILFVVDSSQSMIRTDPTGQRLTAVRDVVNAFINEPGVSFGVIQFAGATNVLTQDETGQDGFTRDLMELESAIVRLGQAEQTTDYEGALANVVRVLSRDMMDADEVELSRAKYVVIFLSDGLPNPVRPPTNTRSSILERVDEILELQRIFRPAEIRVHTALALGAAATGFRCTDSGLEGGQANCESLPTAALCAQEPGCVWVGVEQEAEALLSSMSEAGEGTFRSFRNGEEINFLRIDFTSIRRVFTLKNMVVSNVNTRPTLTFVSADDRIGRATGDSDGDGLSDEVENRVGSDILLEDTDGDGFHDFLEVRLSASGFDPLDPSDADCALAIDRLDTDGDGLRDCEERFVGTSRNFVDSDADGFPDAIELRYGTNPVSDDSLVDLDFDGARNGDELRGHSDPVVNDAANRSGVAYRYEVVEQRLENVPPDSAAAAAMQAGQACYEFRVENVTLVETADGGRNRILLYVGQAPFDDPTDRGVFRVACVEQTFVFPDFRDPPFSEVVIPSSAFVSPTAFNPDVDCSVGSPP
ncbi:MAG: VWA domain-containing protein [Myxococcota bacterium]